MAKHCHVAESLCRISARIAVVLPSIFASNASILIYSNLPSSFRSIWVAHNKLHSANPIKCRAVAWNHGYSALPTMLMNGRAYPTIFYSWDYGSVSNFHRQTRYDAKDLSFSIVGATVHTWKDVVRRLSASTNPYIYTWVHWGMPDITKYVK